MKFYSHVQEINGKREGTKLIWQHANNVYHNAAFSLYPKNNLNTHSSEIKNILKDLTFFHDLGKYTIYFQNYLFGKTVSPKQLKNHSHIGAYTILNKYMEQPEIAGFLYFILLNHHSNFDNILETGIFPQEQNITYITTKQMEDISLKAEIIIEELNNNPISAEFITFPDPGNQKRIRKTIKKRLIKTPTIQDYFTINYLFSLLIEADKLDASGTPLYTRKSLPANAVDNFIGKANTSVLLAIEELSGFEQNKLRNWVRAKVLENLNDPDILNHNLFTLTAPTGIGKTLTALDFALRLKKKIREKENFEPQIIYGMPFINIIEQGLKVYQDVFKGSDVKILGHYQYADIFGEEKEKENRDNGGDNYNKKLMQLNTWQADVVITSFVQFFETLISNRNKMLLKFNHLAGSIVILDEIQTLRLEQLPLIGTVLYFLAKYLNTRIILMTATKPKIFELANKEILISESEKAIPYELLQTYEKVFQKFNRTQIIPLLDKPIETPDDFYDIFNEKRKHKQSCLIVCNTVQRSIDIYNKLSEEGISPLYYLSTNIVPAVRLDRIKKIKKDILQGKAPVLVSTQVVEAGVDLDFDMGFRDLGPIDSIVQVAGRINRENNPAKVLSPLYIIKYQNEKGKIEAEYIYDRITCDQVVKALSEEKIEEKDYLHLVDDYFSDVASKEAYDKARKLFTSMKRLRYDSDNQEFPVSSFKIINDSPWAVSVFIEMNDEAKKAKAAYDDLLSGNLSKEKFDRNYKKAFNQYILAVPEKFTESLENINEFTENIMVVNKSSLTNYYNDATGFIRKKISYSFL
jgi:CRISPR-associated endonuclease/helicase Cas3